ncbi:hypothetical protein ABZP36_026588 [Zizania latifolia]
MTAAGVHAPSASALLSARRGRGPAELLHARLLVSGGLADPAFLARLVSLYAAAGRLRAFHAHHLHAAGLRTYAALIARLARPHPVLAFSLFALSSSSSRAVRTSFHVVSAVLTACACLPLIHGRQVHACAVKVVPPGDVFVYTGLVDVYAKCGDMVASRKAFDEMPRRSVPSWNALVVGYARNGMFLEALRVFKELVEQGLEVPLDQVSLSSALSACTGARDTRFGRQLHTYSIKVGLKVSALCVTNALLDMYTKCCCFREALALFDATGCKDVVTWNIVIVGCLHENRFKEACVKFRSMFRGGVLPDDVSFATALQASACLASCILGATIHASVVKTGFSDSPGLSSSLITMYSKCGCLDDACRAFNLAEDHLCVMPWTAMITALQQHGHGGQAIDLFETMLEKGIKPDHVTFVSVLSSCSHSGLVEEGRKYFNLMTQVHRITPWSEHYACMIDMFGRAGLLSEAKQLIDQMPVKPDESVLGALLAASLNCGELELGRKVAMKLFEIEPGNSGNYVLLANIYASHGRLEAANEVRRWMAYQEIIKEKGCSLFNIENRINGLFGGFQKLH